MFGNKQVGAQTPGPGGTSLMAPRCSCIKYRHIWSSQPPELTLSRVAPRDWTLPGALQASTKFSCLEEVAWGKSRCGWTLNEGGV